MENGLWWVVVVVLGMIPGMSMEEKSLPQPASETYAAIRYGDTIHPSGEYRTVVEVCVMIII